MTKMEQGLRNRKKVRGRNITYDEHGLSEAQHGTIHEKTYLLAVEMAKNQIKGLEEDETRAKEVRG